MMRPNAKSGAVGVPRPLFLDIEALRIVAGYAHWIPITQGLHRDHFKKYLPGWSWNQIIPVLLKREILVIHSKDPNYQHLSQGLFISREIEGIEFSIKQGKTEVSVKKVEGE